MNDLRPQLREREAAPQNLRNDDYKSVLVLSLKPKVIFCRFVPSLCSSVFTLNLDHPHVTLSLRGEVVSGLQAGSFEQGQERRV